MVRLFRKPALQYLSIRIGGASFPNSISNLLLVETIISGMVYDPWHFLHLPLLHNATNNAKISDVNAGFMIKHF